MRHHVLSLIWRQNHLIPFHNRLQGIITLTRCEIISDNDYYTTARTHRRKETCSQIYESVKYCIRFITHTHPLYPEHHPCLISHRQQRKHTRKARQEPAKRDTTQTDNMRNNIMCLLSLHYVSRFLFLYCVSRCCCCCDCTILATTIIIIKSYFKCE